MSAAIRVFLAGAWICAASAANAAPIFTITGGSSVAEMGNNFQWITGPVTEGGALELSEPGIVTIEYLGTEAGFAATEFWFGALAHPGGQLVATTNAGLPIIEGQTASLPFPPPGIVRGLAPFSTAPLDAGIVPFHFVVPGNADALVANGDPPGLEGLPSIAIWWPTQIGALGDTAYLLLDDGGGFNPGEPSDRDHDDMILRLTVRAVPEPGTCEMLVAGFALLGALGLPRRSRVARWA
jgi:hypothetical protein